MSEEKVVDRREDPGDPGEAAREASPEPDPGKEGPLQFDKADFDEAPAAPTCVTCSRPVESSYYQIGDAVVCAGCKDPMVRALSAAKAGGRLSRGALFGSGAALLGAIVWYAIREATGYEIGLVAIAVGIFVGVAVKRGSGGFGGARYQAVAMVLTYASITLANVPAILSALADAPPPPSDVPPPVPTLPGFFLAWGLIFALALVSPFLGGVQNIIGILIIGIGLYEAWKINRYVAPAIRGPFEVSGGADGAAVDAPPGSG